MAKTQLTKSGGNWLLTETGQEQHYTNTLTTANTNLEGNIIIDITCKDAGSLTASGVTNSNTLSIDGNGNVTSNSLQVKTNISSDGYISKGDTTITLTNFQCGKISMGSYGEYSYGSYKGSITPSIYDKYVGFTSGYFPTGYYYRIEKIDGYYIGGRTTGASFRLSRDEYAIVLTDKTTLHYSAAGTYGADKTVEVGGGAVVFYNWATSQWVVFNYNDNSTTLSSAGQQDVWVSSDKAMRKMYVKFY